MRNYCWTVGTGQLLMLKFLVIYTIHNINLMQGKPMEGLRKEVRE